jgi:hypothetical protein
LKSKYSSVPPQLRDCWYFYTLNPLDRYLTGQVDLEPDQTIEILMTELNPEIMKIFSREFSKNGKEATKVILIQSETMLARMLRMNFPRKNASRTC